MQRRRTNHARGRIAALVTVLAVGALVAGVAGCSHGSEASSSSAHGVADDNAAAAGGGAKAASAPEPDSAVAAPAAGGSSGSGSDSNSLISQVNLHSTALIKTADLTVATPKVASQAQQAVTIAEQAGGGESGEVQDAGDAGGAGATADLILQVPPDQLGGALKQLAALGTERSLHVTSQDVTGQVADVNSRVSSAQASIAQLQDLFARATSITDVVALENDLEQREADLESLQAQQRALSAQTSYATITLHLITPSAAVVNHHKATGFGHGLTRGWSAFTSTSVWVLTALGAIAPFLVVVLLVGLAVIWIRRRTGSGLTPVVAGTPPIGADDSGPGVVE